MTQIYLGTPLATRPQFGNCWARAKQQDIYCTRVEPYEKAIKAFTNSHVLSHHDKTCVFGQCYWQYQALDQESAV